MGGYGPRLVRTGAAPTPAPRSRQASTPSPSNEHGSSPDHLATGGAPVPSRLEELRASMAQSPRVQAMTQLRQSMTQSPRVLGQPTHPPQGRSALVPMPASPGQAPPVQRVIAGLEDYTDPTKIPGEWLDAYREDILHERTHVTDEHVFVLYGLVRGVNPDEEGVVFRHEDGNHWDVQINGKKYLAMPDGSCALHAIDLVNRVKSGEAINGKVPYAASQERVNALRHQLDEHVREVEGEAETKRVIAAAINNATLIVTAGFGPKLSTILRKKVILGTAQGPENMFEIAYARTYDKFWKPLNMPKTSEAKNYLGKQGFFSRKEGFASLEEMMQQALASLFSGYVTGMNLKSTGEPYASVLKTGIEQSLSHFESAKEAESKFSKLERKYEAQPRGKKRRLSGGNKFLKEEDSKKLSGKLKNEKFQKKLMRASKKAKGKLEEQSAEVAKVVEGGSVDLTGREISTAEKFGAFAAFSKPTKSKVKKDLKVKHRGGGEAQSSFGKGGFQVKGLGTYSAEMIWFIDKFKTWKCSYIELFQAMQEHNYKELLRLTNNAQDADHLARFGDLQGLEKWRAQEFGTGVAAWENLGYHGQITFSEYMQEMPMREEDATTNVAKTTDTEHPFDAELWARQQQSMVTGIERLMEVEIEEGATYNERARVFLQQAAEEPEDGEPSEQMIWASSEFLQSPNPYQNRDDDPPEKTS